MIKQFKTTKKAGNLRVSSFKEKIFCTSCVSMCCPAGKRKGNKDNGVKCAFQLTILTSDKSGDGGDNAVGADDDDDKGFMIVAVAWFRIDDPLQSLAAMGSPNC